MAGACRAGEAVVCAGSTDCLASGTCNPASGQCVATAAEEGLACAGGTCAAGACRSSAPREVSARVDASLGAELVVSDGLGNTITLIIPGWALQRATWVTLRGLAAGASELSSSVGPGIELEPAGLELARPGRLRVRFAAPRSHPERAAFVRTSLGGPPALVGAQSGGPDGAETNLIRLGRHELVDVAAALLAGEFSWPPAAPAAAGALLDLAFGAETLAAIAFAEPCAGAPGCHLATPAVYRSQARQYLESATTSLVAMGVPADPDLFLRDLYSAESLAAALGAPDTTLAGVKGAVGGSDAATGGLAGRRFAAEAAYCAPAACAVGCNECPDVGAWAVRWLHAYGGTGSWDEVNPGYWTSNVTGSYSRSHDGFARVHAGSGFMSDISLVGSQRSSRHEEGNYVVPPTCTASAGWTSDQSLACTFSEAKGLAEALSAAFGGALPLVSHLADPFHLAVTDYGFGSCHQETHAQGTFCSSSCGMNEFYPPETACSPFEVHQAPPPVEMGFGPSVPGLTATPMLPTGPEGLAYAKSEPYFGFIDPGGTVPASGVWQVEAAWEGPPPRKRCGPCALATECTTAQVCNPRTGACEGGDPRPGPCHSDDRCAAYSCQAGACVLGRVKTCPGTDSCNAAFCDPASGACLREPLPAGVPCDDRNSCTSPDTCDGDGGCVGRPVARGVPCTSASVCNVCNGAGACERLTQRTLDFTCQGLIEATLSRCQPNGNTWRVDAVRSNADGSTTNMVACAATGGVVVEANAPGAAGCSNAGGSGCSGAVRSESAASDVQCASVRDPTQGQCEAICTACAKP
ncbi:MAG: hypothetical protein IPO09_09820 [Anaeromyxobacter sp.]|nr:hypothetical protein [Anaeromyxobacter sp.]MBL0278590.1 hypothetical protein [Anaeromyxobacter sp.]